MLEVEHVFKIFGKDETEVVALKDVSFSAQKGEFAALAGPSGSGKTTLLNMIGCIDDLTKGDITLDGQSIVGYTNREKTEFRRQYLGFIFQAYNLIPVLTVFENVAFPLRLMKMPEKEVKAHVLEILEHVGLSSKVYKKPSEISGGQQQRVAIARALVKKPALILADEPTANLDSKTGEDILKLMKTLNEEHQVTFLFSTHDRLVMEYARRIIRLSDGQIVGDERKS